jgi:hypothetical protein
LKESFNGEKCRWYDKNQGWPTNPKPACSHPDRPSRDKWVPECLPDCKGASLEAYKKHMKAEYEKEMRELKVKEQEFLRRMNG